MYRPNEQGQRSRVGEQGHRRVDTGSLLDLVSPEEGANVSVAHQPDITDHRPSISTSPREEPLAFGGRLFPRLHELHRLGVDDVVAWMHRGMLWILAVVVIGISAAAFYGLTAAPRYTVYTDVVVDPSNLNVVSDDVFTTNPQRDAQLLEVESKLRVLTSRNVLARVVEKLDLEQDPEFVKPEILAPIKKLFGLAPAAADNRLAVMRGLEERVEARREERSFVVVMKVWTEDPEKSVILSNAIVEAFETELFQSAAESAGRVARGLNERLDELRRNVTEAEAKVEAFRRANGLLSNNGELVSTTLSGELNTQVLDAQQRFIQAESRYRQMSAAVAQGQTASASVFESETMNNLREQYNTVQQQVGSLQLTYGGKHPRLASAQTDQRTLEGALASEAHRILERARADFDREKAAFEELRKKADTEKSNAYSDNDAQVQLRDLERDARAKAMIYETHLTRAQQIAERQQIDTTNVRVISRAMPPNARSWPPRTLLLMIAGGALGLMIGVMSAFALGLWGYARSERPRVIA